MKDSDVLVGTPAAPHWIELPAWLLFQWRFSLVEASSPVTLQFRTCVAISINKTTSKLLQRKMIGDDGSASDGLMAQPHVQKHLRSTIAFWFGRTFERNANGICRAQV